MIRRRNLHMHRRCVCLWPAFLIILAYVQQAIAVRNETRCGSIDIRNNPRMAFQPKHLSKKDGEWLKYRDCTIMEGDFTLSMITQSNITDDMFPVFENLREITGAILVYQIKGLLSLGRMFPNLRVIGGHSLIMNYALVIYQNYDLRDVGLTKLTTIKNGGVRITENSRLCYARSINWDIILRGKIRDLIIDQVAGQCKSDCNVKDDSNCFRDAANNNLPYCWNSTHCQTVCQGKHSGSGCTDDGEPCHPFCLGGCSRPDDPGACHTCRDLDVDGICVQECPEGMFEQLGRRCLTETECYDLHPVAASPGRSEKSKWKTFENQCHYDCPNGFQEDPSNPHKCIPCSGYCPKKCSGDTVDSIGSAMKFSKCNMIEGNLELDMRIGMESTSAEKFTEAFGDIEEITGYLLIRFSSAFMSLHMFKKLRIIHGQILWKNMYALVVFENQNLNQLFNMENKQMQIMRGKVSFQNNRMLCYKKIEAFLEQVGLKENVTENDVSPFSNGDKAICEEIPLEVKIVEVYNYGFVVRWVPFNTSDMDHRKFLGYQIFYKKVEREDPNMSIDDERSACSDSWNMQFVTDERDAGKEENGSGLYVQEYGNNAQLKGELINQGVDANTLYAVYVQTRLVQHPGARNAISKIHFVRTTFGVPDPPKRFRESQAISADSLKLSWDPPVNTHGDITHYTITWNLVAEPKLDTDVCSVKQSHRNHASGRSSSGLVSLSNSQSTEDTCPAIKGCCKCSQTNSQELNSNLVGKTLEEHRGESATFEDIIQNKVFVQKGGNRDKGMGPSNSSSQSSKKKRRSLSSVLGREIIDKDGPAFGDPPSVVYHNLEELNVSADSLDASFNITFGKINITGTSLVLTGLPHYSEYHIAIYACQDIRHFENYCSARPLWTAIRTEAIPEYDVIEPESVVLYNVTDGKKNDKKIYWSAPQTPNGYVLGYHAKLIRDDSLEHRWSTDFSTEQCIGADDFEENKGISFYGLSDGRYTLEVRVVTSTNYHNNATTVKDIFVLYTPGFFTTKVIAITVAIGIAIVLVLGVAVYYIVGKVFGRKLDEYMRQTISANPEYLSQMDIYKADEWELKREDLELLEEIGRGTFGKVLKGYGKDIHSVTGEVFGECAVKTVPETASNAERLHFLIEASVMKQFNTEFIVKLYGVVSDGQPVLVVMELMEKGNLRDFLRSHRPNAEENKENLSVPSLTQYFTWASQIADGMAYLESLKFCHRDLAARNCMVHADESVKIGDFGMARDIYYHEYYKPAGKRLMPVRWMAPESLKDGKFTMKSDVWSFGIVMYEMLTLGQQPYAGLRNDQVFNYIGVQRQFMRKPRECPIFWYKLMRCCWRYDPRERPSFHHIVRHLRQHTTESFQELSFVLNKLELSKEVDLNYDFDIDIKEDMDDQGNIYNNPEEFGYHQSDDEDEEDEDNYSKSDEFQSEEDLQTPSRTPLCNNNRRPMNEGIADVRGGGSPRHQMQEVNQDDVQLVENTF